MLDYFTVYMFSKKHNTYALNRRDIDIRDIKKEFDDFFEKYMRLCEDVIDKDLSNESVDLESRERLDTDIFKLEYLLYTISNKKEVV